MLFKIIQETLNIKGSITLKKFKSKVIVKHKK